VEEEEEEKEEEEREHMSVIYISRNVTNGVEN